MDPLSLVVSAIGLLQAVSATYTTVSEIIDRPKAFDVVSKHLPLVEGILSTTKQRLEAQALTSTSADESAAIRRLLQDCRDNAKELKRIFDTIEAKRSSDEAAISWKHARAWYRTALKGIKAHRVEALMDEILKTTEQLMYHQILQLSTREDVAKIRSAIEELADVEPSLDDAELDARNTVIATQTVETGAYGQQNNPTGGVNTFMSGQYNVTGDGHTISFVVSGHDYLSGLFTQGQPHPPNEKARIERQKGGLLTESSSWILKTGPFRAWLDRADGSGLLHVRGDPGKGKTMLLCGIINELEELVRAEKMRRSHPTSSRRQFWRLRSRPQLPDGADMPSHVAYFFCRAGEAQLDSATAVLRALLRMVFTQQKTLWAKYNAANASELPPLDVSSWDALESFFKQVVQDPDFETTYLVVDALDECDHDRDALLGFLARLPPSRVRVVVSSRNWLYIERRLSAAAGTLSLSLEHRANKAIVAEAVRLYINNRVKRLSDLKGYGSNLRRQVEDLLRAKSANTFLWVSIVCDSLSQPDVEKWNTIDRIDSFPCDMKLLYQRIIRQIRHSGSASLARMLLALVLVVKRPVTLSELGSLVEWPSGFPRGPESVREALGLCRCLLNAHEGEVSLVHHSARDFLSEDEDAYAFIFPRGPDHENLVVAMRSVHAMAAVLRRNVCCLPRLWTPVTAIDKSSLEPLLPVHYSCVYWAHHLAQAPPEASRQVLTSRDGPIHHFMTTHFLHWLEALSLLGETWTAIPSLFMLDALAERRERTRAPQAAGQFSLAELVHDAWRFAKQHADAISLGPSQIYTSALLFSPERSITRQNHQTYEPAWGHACDPATGGNWSACLQNLEGHSDAVSRVVFSPDGQLLASASLDATVRVWDTLTGRCQSVLRPGSAVLSVAFSPDGRLLASGDKDGIVTLWDRRSGERLNTFKDHAGAVNTVVFSPQDDYLASGSDDGTVRFWNTATGASSGIIVVDAPNEGHGGGEVLNLTISADGRYLEASYRGDTAAFEMTSTGVWAACTALPKPQRAPMPLMTSLLLDRNAAEFPADRGLHRLSWGFYTLQAPLFAVSDAGDHIVLAHERQVFSYSLSAVPYWNRWHEWDKSPWIGRHGNRVGCVALSPGLDQYASGDDGGLIKIWDMSISDCLPQTHVEEPVAHEFALSQKCRIGSAIALSPDETVAAVFDGYNPVSLWTNLAGRLSKRTVAGQTPMAFSPDSRFFASLANQFIHQGWKPFTLPPHIWVGLWDAATGVLVKKFQYVSYMAQWNPARPCEDVHWMVFSPDGSLLALLLYSEDESVGFTAQVWDVETEKCLHVQNHFRHRDGLGDASLHFHRNTFSPLEWDELYGLRRAFRRASGPPRPTTIACFEYFTCGRACDEWVPPAGALSDTLITVPASAEHRLQIRENGDWVELDWKKFLWLPPEWRPRVVEARGETLVTSFGRPERVVWIRVPPDI